MNFIFHTRFLFMLAALAALLAVATFDPPQNPLCRRALAGWDIVPGKRAGGLATTQPTATQPSGLRLVPGVSITLTARKEGYFLGENILLDYRVRYDGDETLWGSLVWPCEVVSTDESGQPMRPCAIEWHSSGQTCVALRKGQTLVYTVPLMRYIHLDKPGRYRVRVAHDLIGPGRSYDTQFPQDDPRWAETILTVKMPSGVEALQVVERMTKLPPYWRDLIDIRELFDLDKGYRDYRDFTCFRYGIYVPILADQAARGSADAVTGIAHIPTTQATVALVKLLSSSNDELAMKAAWAINDRLPDPPGCEQSRPGPRRTGPARIPSWPDRRNWLQDPDAEPDELRNCWDDRTAAEVRRFARGLLSDVPATLADATRLHCGGFMLESLATAEDMEATAAALDNAAPHAVAGDPRWLFAEYSHHELTWRKVTARLIGAARTAAKRGAAFPDRLDTPGRMIQWGLVIRERPTSRPDGWEKEYARLLGADWPYVRETLLRNAPRPLGQPILDQLEKLLGDGDPYVAVAALEAVAECKPDIAKRFCDAVTHVIEKTQDERVLCATPQAAAAVGLPRDQYFHRLVDRLDSPQLYLNAEWQLFGVLNGRPWLCCRVCGRYPKDPAILQRTQAAWHQFINANAEAIRAGRRFKPGDPEIAPGMLDGLYLGAYRPGPPETAPAERE